MNPSTSVASKKNKIECSTRSMNFSKNVSKSAKEFEKDLVTTILEQPEHLKPSRDFSGFFDSSTPEIHVVETRVTQFGRNTIPYLHNQMVQEELTLPPGPKLTTNIKSEEICLEDLYSQVFTFFQYGNSKNHAEDETIFINKLMNLSIGLLKNFLSYLEQLENIYRTEDIEQLDRIFLLKNSSDYSKNKEQISKTDCEIGVRAGRTIQLVAELLPYNDYLKNLLIGVIKNNEVSTDMELVGDFKKKDFYFLVIDDILRKIHSLRKTEVCSTLLNSVAKLLLVVSQENLYTSIFSVFKSLIGSLLFTRPPGEILHKVLSILKYCSPSKNFLDFLCTKPDFKKFTVDKKRKLNFFSEETCKFTLFVFLLNNSLKNICDDNLLMDVAFDVFSFVNNIFINNPYWVHDEQENRCACLEQLYQLIIEVLYSILMKFKLNKNHSQKSKYKSVFKCGIRVFELLFFNSYDSLEKFIETYAKYKEICKHFLEFEEDLNLTEEAPNLERLCIFEEVPVIHHSKFELI